MDNNTFNNNVPNNNNAPNNDAVAARRRALAEALRNGQPTVVTPSGEVDFQESAEENGQGGIQVPNGKLAVSNIN
jgi:hypothetical protein